MASLSTVRPEFVPHLPDLIVSVGNCWRTILDAQTEADPFGANFDALEEARVALEALADRLTGQAGFFRLVPRSNACDLPLDAAPF